MWVRWRFGGAPDAVVRRRATAAPTVPNPRIATRQRALTMALSLISPRAARGGNWHLNRDRVAWLPWRHRACPSATLDEARLTVVGHPKKPGRSQRSQRIVFSALSAFSAVFSSCETILKPRDASKSTYMDTWIKPSTRRPAPPA